MNKSKFIFICFFIFFNNLAFSKSPEEYCITSKENVCVNPYGENLGSFENVTSYSNCRSECVKMVKNFVQGKDIGTKDKVYSGISWQCVEYARRWWMLELGISFGSVDTADQIFKLNEAERISDGRKIQLTSFENSSKKPPSVGDLLIYDKQKDNPNFQYGHVAVVVGVNLNKGYIELAEQNYDNKKWENKNRFSRKIAITMKDNLYKIYDINFKDFNANKSYESSNRILGWVRADF